MTVRSSASSKNLEVFNRFNEMTVTGDLDSLEEVLDPDYTQVIPQCGELVRGVENVRALDHRILRQTSFFAPKFDSPAWRAQWVERIAE